MTDQGVTAFHRVAAKIAPDVVNLVLDTGASIDATTNFRSDAENMF